MIVGVANSATRLASSPVEKVLERQKKHTRHTQKSRLKKKKKNIAQEEEPIFWVNKASKHSYNEVTKRKKRMERSQRDDRSGGNWEREREK